jgi:hypothetical protein
MMLTYADVLGKSVYVRQGFVQQGDAIRKVEGVTGLVVEGYIAHTIDRENPDRETDITMLVILLDDQSIDDEGTVECPIEDVKLTIEWAN